MTRDDEAREKPATEAPPRDREPSTARGEATREKLLEAAERLFGREGYHRTSVAGITREAGVGHGTFYLYFESKEEIFRELVQHLSHELRATIAEAVEGLDHRLEVERVGFRTFFRFAREHRNLYRIVHEAESVDPSLARWYYERIGRGYAEGLRAAMDAGQIRRLDPEAVAYALAGIGHMLGVRWVLWEEQEPPEAWMETLVSLLRDGLLPDEDDGGDAAGGRSGGSDASDRDAG